MSLPGLVLPLLDVLPGWPVPPAHSPLDILWFTVVWPFAIAIPITAIGLRRSWLNRHRTSDEVVLPRGLDPNA